jgi:hypothetical protein
MSIQELYVLLSAEIESAYFDFAFYNVVGMCCADCLVNLSEAELPLLIKAIELKIQIAEVNSGGDSLSVGRFSESTKSTNNIPQLNSAIKSILRQTGCLKSGVIGGVYL